MCESLGKWLHPTKEFYGCPSQALIEGKPIAASEREKAYRDEDRVQSGAILSSAVLWMLMAPELAGRNQEIQLSIFWSPALPGSGCQGSSSWGADPRLWSMYVIWGERGWRCRVSGGSGILAWRRPIQRTACALELRRGDNSVAEVFTEKAAEGLEGRWEARTS